MITPRCFFVPPHITAHIARTTPRENADPTAASRTAVVDNLLRQQRKSVAYANLQTLTPPRPGKGDRQIFHGLLELAGVLRHGHQPEAGQARQHQHRRRRSNVNTHLGPPQIKDFDTPDREVPGQFPGSGWKSCRGPVTTLR